MENPKIKPLKDIKTVTFYSLEHKKPYHLERKFVVSPTILKQQHTAPKVEIQPHHKFEYPTQDLKFSKIYWSAEYDNRNDFEEWCSHINSIDISYEGKINPSLWILELCKNIKADNLKPVILEVIDAINEYIEQKKEYSHISDISTDSAIRFLLLVPVLATHKPRVYIDTNNGFFNVDLPTRDNGILSTQISNNGQIHYSYVAQNNKIFKITGTAKFKDSRDFIKFNKVLRML